MGMVIKNNIDSVRTYNIYNRNTIALSDAMYKVSSGQRINSAQDGASDLAISENMRTRIRSVDQANRNAQNGNSMMKTAEGALTNIADILASAREKAVAAANASMNDTDRTLAQSEITQLAAQLTRNLDVSFNTQALLDGSELRFQIGDDTSDTWVITMPDASAIDLTGITGLASADDANTSISEIDALITTLNGYLADIGSYETQFGYTADNLATMSENMQAAESTIRDMDMAKGMTEFMKMNVLTQASQFMLAQAGQNAYSVLNLLQQ